VSTLHAQLIDAHRGYDGPNSARSGLDALDLDRGIQHAALSLIS